MRRFTRRIRCLDANGNITADYFQHETWVLVPAAGLWMLVHAEVLP
jgi:hypothetical protein